MFFRVATAERLPENFSSIVFVIAVQTMSSFSFLFLYFVCFSLSLLERFLFFQTKLDMLIGHLPSDFELRPPSNQTEKIAKQVTLSTAERSLSH